MNLYLVARVTPSAVLNPIVGEFKDSAEAIAYAAGRSSVLDLDRGSFFAAWRLGRYPEQVHVQYSKPPFEECKPTGAEKIFRPVGRPRVQVAE